MKTKPIPSPQSDSRVFETLRAAAAGLGVPLHVLRQVKKVGARGFHGHRIHAGELLIWLKENRARLGAKDGQPTREQMEIRKLTLQCERLQVELDEQRGKLIDAGELARAAYAVESARKAMFRQRMEIEAPPQLVGKPIEQLRKICADIVDEVCALHQELYERAKRVTHDKIDAQLCETCRAKIVALFPPSPSGSTNTSAETTTP